jgi:hypothetical protein
LEAPAAYKSHFGYFARQKVVVSVKVAIFSHLEKSLQRSQLPRFRDSLAVYKETSFNQIRHWLL